LKSNKQKLVTCEVIQLSFLLEFYLSNATLNNYYHYSQGHWEE